MIDAWFAGLIGFNFAIVILNVAINSFVSSKVNPTSVQKMNVPHSRSATTAGTINKWAKVVLALAFTAFFLGYVFLAM